MVNIDPKNTDKWVHITPSMIHRSYLDPQVPLNALNIHLTSLHLPGLNVAILNHHHLSENHHQSRSRKLNKLSRITTDMLKDKETISNMTLEQFIKFISTKYCKGGLVQETFGAQGLQYLLVCKRILEGEVNIPHLKEILMSVDDQNRESYVNEWNKNRNKVMRDSIRAFKRKGHGNFADVFDEGLAPTLTPEAKRHKLDEIDSFVFPDLDDDDDLDSLLGGTED